MRLLQTDTFKIFRASKGFEGYDDGNGNWVSSNQSTNQFKAKGSIQPVTSEDLRLLPESFKSTAMYKIYTKSELRSVDQFGQSEADTIEIDNQKYQVQIVEKWRQLHTSHYKVFVGRKEKN